MLRLVGSGEGYSEDDGRDAPERGRASEEPAGRTESQIKRATGELFVQLPADDDEALAVAEYLLELARWRANRSLEIKRAERALASLAQDEGLPMLVVLTHSAMEECLSRHGFTGAANNYAARVIRGGYLSPKHFKA